MYAFTKEDGPRGRHGQIVEREVDLTKDQLATAAVPPTGVPVGSIR